MPGTLCPAWREALGEAARCWLASVVFLFLALQERLERLQIVLDSRLVPGVLAVGDSRPMHQREHELAAISVGQDPHGIVDRRARFQGDVVIQDAKCVSLREPHSY